MLKPDSLRAALTAAVPDLRTDPDRLRMFIDKGNLVATAVPLLAFEYRYRLQLLLLDFAGHPDQIMVPLLAWVAVNQNELLANADRRRDGISFQAELLDSQRVDLAIELMLTEAVSVRPATGGGQDVIHHPEPPIAPGFGPEVDQHQPRLWRLFLGAEELLRWEAPDIIRPEPLGLPP
ncbi:MAG: phage tail protein [Sphingomonadales bacterium]|jgi:hypothetical protein